MFRRLLCIVLAISLLVVGIVLLSGLRNRPRCVLSKEDACRMELQVLAQAALIYRYSYGSFPSSDAHDLYRELKPLMMKRGQIADVPNKDGAFVDPWGGRFRARVSNPPESTWTIISPGPNVLFEDGNGDDLSLTVEW